MEPPPSAMGNLAVVMENPVLQVNAQAQPAAILRMRHPKPRSKVWKHFTMFVDEEGVRLSVTIVKLNCLLTVRNKELATYIHT